jgi:hypothetical protein
MESSMHNIEYLQRLIDCKVSEQMDWVARAGTAQVSAFDMKSHIKNCLQIAVEAGEYVDAAANAFVLAHLS